MDVPLRECGWLGHGIGEPGCPQGLVTMARWVLRFVLLATAVGLFTLSVAATVAGDVGVAVFTVVGVAIVGAVIWRMGWSKVRGASREWTASSKPVDRGQAVGDRSDIHSTLESLDAQVAEVLEQTVALDSTIRRVQSSVRSESQRNQERIEQSERKVVQRLRAHHRQLLEAEEESSSRRDDSDALRSVRQRIARQMTQSSRDTVRQVEALLRLSDVIKHPRAPLPSTGGFAIDAGALLHLVHVVSSIKPKRILELGSGTSTIWLGYLCEELGSDLISVDHDEYYLEKTRADVERHGLSGSVDLRLAPLQAVEVAGDDFRWYSLSAFEDVGKIDLLIVDGPPESTGDDARYPAVPLLSRVLSECAVVVLDDAHRDAEQRTLKRWAAEGPYRHVDAAVSRLGVLAKGETL
ncbi:O-methyltransferase [Nesterenkonia sp. HG001]|uniref:O-methyltransferase n=1 Tax=Nesterenkonia sp. HG001 TaxID=2983207 RepID=UPI002AC4C84E|nr:class I SAM-dependent methyltransferase [Nesterenkonia sp. HG001]MDZ5076979.1 class I SAM-dependent methyltransferase [Nesterenkonia sp. HG001]